jgi:transposase
MLPKAAQVVDSFHVISLANRALDAVRRRVQNEQTGHRGDRHDRLFRASRALLVGEERLDDTAAQRLATLVQLGDPNAEVAIAYRIKERLRDFYHEHDPATARVILTELVEHCRRPAMPAERRKLADTLQRWFDKICNYHLAHVSIGPTEALNNLIKRIKRIGFDSAIQQLPDPRPALRRQTQLARPRTHYRPVTTHPVRIRRVSNRRESLPGPRATRLPSGQGTNVEKLTSGGMQ